MPEYAIQYGGKTYSINPPQPLSQEQVQQAFAEITQKAQTEQQGQAAMLNPNTPVEDKRGFFQSILDAGKKAALPTIGGIAGGIAGGLATTPTVAGVPAGVLGGEAAGSAGGEMLNQPLGITDRKSVG